MFSIFSKKGRNLFRKFTVGEVVEDYGIIGKALNGRQTYRMLRCKKNGKLLFVLEVESGGFGSKSFSLFPFDSETTHNIRRILN